MRAEFIESRTVSYLLHLSDRFGYERICERPLKLRDVDVVAAAAAAVEGVYARMQIGIHSLLSKRMHLYAVSPKSSRRRRRASEPASQLASQRRQRGDRRGAAR